MTLVVDFKYLILQAFVKECSLFSARLMEKQMNELAEKVQLLVSRLNSICLFISLAFK